MKNFFYHTLRPSAFSIFLFSTCCLSGTLFCIPPAFAQLSGTYTIGGTGGDYANFSEAADALEAEGVSGPVIFNVRPGTYEEQLMIGSIPGSSCTVPVLFNGEGATPAEVVLQSPEGADFTLQLNNADGIGFHNLSISGDIDALPGTDCFLLEENLIIGAVESLSSAGARSNGHIYTNNTIGSIAKTNQAPWNPAAPVFDDGLIIEGNRIGHISITGQQGFMINDNEIELGSGTGISVTNSWYGLEINGNRLTTESDNFVGTFMVLHSAAAAEITGNYISSQRGGGFAMDFTTGKSLGNEILFANNLLYMSGYDARGHNYFPITNLVGLDIASNYGTQVKIYHNTIRTAGYSEYVPNYALKLAGEANSFHLLNNIIANNSYGTGIVVASPGIIASSDYNNLYMDYSDLFALYGTDRVTNLAGWRSLTGFGTNSMSVNPGPFDNPDPALTGAGTYLSEVPQDFFGQQRNDPPTIGSVEEAPTVIDAPLSGVLRIGGEEADYATFTEAVEALHQFGVKDSVLFQVAPGTYTERIFLNQSFADNPKITFEGVGSEGASAFLQYPFGDVLVLGGTGKYTFRNLVFLSHVQINNPSLLFQYNLFEGGVSASSNNLVFKDNVFNEKGISASGPGYTYVGAGTYLFYSRNNIVIEDNIFNRSGISLSAYEGIFINSNTFTFANEDGSSGGTAISINSGFDIKEINNNVIVSDVPNTTGIYFSGGVYGGETPEQLLQNKIVLRKGGRGLFFDYSLEKNSPVSLVANNMISINTTAESENMGIGVVTLGTGINFFYNSVYLYGSDSTSDVFYTEMDINEPVNLNFKNNIFANLAEGKVFFGKFYIKRERIASSDYNDLYTTGDTFAIWKENVVADLAAWRALTGFDMNSLSVAPNFRSAEELVPQNSTLDGAGLAVAEVQRDFFDTLRETPPTIGAVELVEEGNQAPVVSAGEDKTYTLPLDQFYLRGTGYDPDGRFTAFRWEKVSGPEVSLQNASTANALVTELQPGVYVFRFSATDNDGATSSDEISITIAPAENVNQVPVVNAGRDATITLPHSTYYLRGLAFDSDGRFVRFRWEKVSGPAVTISGQNTANAQLSDLQPGTYVFRFSATDNEGATGSDEVTLTVEPAANQAPVVSAGSDKTIMLPTNTISLSGTGRDPDGRFTAFLWEKVSGPAVTMSGERTANVRLSNLVEGTYVFRFSATDNEGATASDEMMLTVRAGQLAATEVNKMSVSAYPNTFRDYVNVQIEAEEQEQYELRVYDLSGKEYYQGTFVHNHFNGGLHRIDLSGLNLPEGVYLILLDNQARGIRETVKVVKK